MPKFYISFGQAHTHSYNGLTLDKDTLLEIDAPSREIASARAIKLFETKWSMLYPESELEKVLPFFPKGVVNANLRIL